MSFQTKLLISYLSLILLLLSSLGFVFYRYSYNVMQKNALDNLTVIGEKMAWQLDNLVRPMDFITVNLIATDNFMRSMSSLAHLDHNDPGNGIYINEATRYIYVTLCNDSINKNFYSVNMFNQNGDFFSSRIQQPNVDKKSGDLIRSFSWLDQVEALRGKPVMIPPHTDPWNTQPVTVFSFIRAVSSDRGTVGYLEVQTEIAELDKIFLIPSAEGLKVSVFNSDGELFYRGGFEDNKDVFESDNEISLEFPAELTDFKIVLTQDREILMRPFEITLRAAMFAGLAVVIISVLTVFVMSHRLVKPIRELKHQVESTELDTLQHKLPTVTSGNELVALENSFARLRERLNDSINRELRSQSLQMQANFDFLQSQINPHFLYNILNVLAQKGMDIGDDEICEICSGIASMLRYSTSTKERVATIGDEINHIRTYLTLMKKRYEDRIEFNFDVDAETLSYPIPKITLQQLVENSIDHSLGSKCRMVLISIVCKCTAEGWSIEISDTGLGFSPEILEQLNSQFTMAREELMDTNPGFAIGGMGLVNTYARLYMYFKDSFSFDLNNGENGGAKIVLSADVRGEIKCLP